MWKPGANGSNIKQEEPFMNIIVSKNKEELAEKAALTVKELVSKNPKAILGLATGSSPLELYAHLASYCR